MQITKLVWCAVLSFILAGTGFAQSGLQGGRPVGPPRAAGAMNVFDSDPWEIGPVVAGGFGVGDRSSYQFFNAGLHLGKVLTPPAGPGLLSGQFEYAAEIYPYWQAFTPAPHLQTVRYRLDGQPVTAIVPYGGGTFTGASITPIILRWNFRSRSAMDGSSASSSMHSGSARSGSMRLVPWFQGAGGLIWTNHKFPPDVKVQHGDPGGTSVFNFTPQFGIGFNYFLQPRRSISFAANAVHVSSASLGDRNPGVNASVQFQLGYTWWK